MTRTPLTASVSASDPFSRFMNWFSALGKDLPAASRKAGQQDVFSALMNRLSR